MQHLYCAMSLVDHESQAHIIPQLLKYDCTTFHNLTLQQLSCRFNTVYIEWQVNILKMNTLHRPSAF